MKVKDKFQIAQSQGSMADLTRTFETNANPGSWAGQTVGFNTANFTVPSNCLIVVVWATSVSADTNDIAADLFIESNNDLTFTNHVRSHPSVGTSHSGALAVWSAPCVTGQQMYITANSTYLAAPTDGREGDHLFVYQYTHPTGAIPYVRQVKTTNQGLSTGPFSFDLDIAPIFNSEVMAIHVRDTDAWNPSDPDIVGNTAWTEVHETYVRFDTPNYAGSLHVMVRSGNVSTNVAYANVDDQTAIGWSGNAVHSALEIGVIKTDTSSIKGHEIVLGNTMHVSAGSIEGSPDQAGLILDPSKIEMDNALVQDRHAIDFLLGGKELDVASLDIHLWPYFGTYTDFILELYNWWPEISSVDIELTFSSDQGESYEIGASDYEWGMLEGYESGFVSAGYGDVGHTSINMTASGLNTTALLGYSGSMYILGPGLWDSNGVNRTPSVMWAAYYNDSGSVATHVTGFGRYDGGGSTTMNIDAIRLAMDTANIEHGEWVLYGLRTP